MSKENINHPQHYGGGDNPTEAIKVIEAWGLDFCLGNTVKYISRAGKKDPEKELEDLQKASWYLKRRIDQIRLAQEKKENSGACTSYCGDTHCEKNGCWERVRYHVDPPKKSEITNPKSEINHV